MTRPPYGLHPYGLYLHVPFCAVRCHYCDFNTYDGLEAQFEPYVAALCAEIRHGGAARGRPQVRTLFIGGGTPTVLAPELLGKMLEACGEAFDILPGAEITSEANPGTVDRARFTTLRALGINRLSMGVQSFDDAELRWLGRMHSADEAVRSFESARAAGFEDINLDFMFGLPRQQPATWSRTLARALTLAPEHLSLYSLIVEDGTPLADWVRRGVVTEPDDDLAADLYLDAMETLDAHGLEQYEISNWGRQGRECRHNLVYWRNEPYLGFGAGAHSFDFDPGEPGAGRRWWNVRPVPAYIKRIQAGHTANAGDEIITPRLAMGETMMVGLRLVREGVTDDRFRARFGVSLDDTFGEIIAGLVADGLLERLPDRIRLTEQGRLLGNQVFAAFLP